MVKYIALHIDTQHDTSLMDALYKGIKVEEGEMIVLYNSPREEIDKTLKEYPDATLICVGHGCPSGLFGFHGGMAIDSRSVDLLKTRDVIGVWCNACDFAKQFSGVKGFFTDMFISNPSECSMFGYRGHTDAETDEQNVKFCEKVVELINEGIPTSEWVGIFKEWCDKDIDFVAYNYGISKPLVNDIRYFDGSQEGTRKPYYQYYGWDDFKDEDTLFCDSYDEDEYKEKAVGDYTIIRDLVEGKDYDVVHAFFKKDITNDTMDIGDGRRCFDINFGCIGVTIVENFDSVCEVSPDMVDVFGDEGYITTIDMTKVE